MKTLKVRKNFETQFDCLVSFNSDTDGLKSGRQVAVRYLLTPWSRDLLEKLTGSAASQ